jgi:ATP-binding cassette, subfamily B, bacterial
MSDLDWDLAMARRRARSNVTQLFHVIGAALQLVRLSGGGAGLATVVLQLLNALLIAAQVLVLRSVVQRTLTLGRHGSSLHTLLWPIVALGILSVLQAVVGVTNNQLDRYLSQLMLRRMTSDLFATTAKLPLAAYDNPAFHDRLQLLQTNALLSPLQLVQGLVQLLGGAVASVSLVITLEIIHPLLAPILLAAGIPLFLLSRISSRLEYDFVLNQTPATRERAYLAELLLSREAAKETIAYSTAGVIQARHRRSFDDFIVALRRQAFRMVAVNGGGAIVSAGTTAAALLALLLLIQRNAISLADAGAAAVAIRLLASQIAQLFAGIATTLEAGLFVDDMAEFNRAVEAAVDDGDRAGLIGRFTPLRELRAIGLSYTYPGANAPAVSDVDLTINAGEILALVGENGSGKSTLAKLLGCLYPPSHGQVLWNGDDMALLDVAQLRQRIAVVFQDFVRYDLPAQLNVGLGRVSAVEDRAAIEQAARHAGILEYLQTLPDGLDTMLGRRFSRSQDLSLGQWQRVALARGIFREADLLVLDEPSSSLDPKAEERLVEQLRTTMAGHTVVLISHRFSTVRTADRIAVMRGGALAEVGSHEELMARNGVYAELFTLQSIAYLRGMDTT